MSRSEEDIELLVEAICYRLSLEERSSRLEDRWEKFVESRDYQQQAWKISQFLAQMFERAFANMLGLRQPITRDDELFIKLWETNVPKILMGKYVSERDEKHLKRLFKKTISEVLKSKNIGLPPVSPNQTTKPDLFQAKLETWQGENSNLHANRTDSLKFPPESIPPENIQQPVGGSVTHTTESHPQEQGKILSSTNQTQQPIEPDTNTSVIGQWKYLPLPENEPDPHTEFSHDSQETPQGLKIIGARVRGKMHKHQGTNCDDWFEFTTSGNWTIIAVSDGSGSSKFSRVGAKLACEQAVKYLAEELGSHQINELDTTAQSSFSPNEDIDFAKNCLHGAMKAAYDAVKEEAEKRQNDQRYFKALGERELNIKDLSATLLLAIHTTMKVGGNEYSLVLTCQIGDGMLAAISQEGKLILLGQPDSGEFAGQTEFLTSKNKVETENLLRKTFTFIGKLRILLVMTDGVSDNYFPNDPGMLELYGDLVLNQVINIPKANDEDIVEELLKKPANIGSIGGIKTIKDSAREQVNRILPVYSEEPKTINISSIAKYAAELGNTVAEVIANPKLLAAGVMEEEMCNECKGMEPEKKLEIWLDAYYQKGSFDDRTLVALYREEVNE